MIRAHLTNPHEPRFGRTDSFRGANRIERQRLLVMLATNYAGRARRNPYGKRLCGRAAALLVTQVEQPHRAPRALQHIPQNPLRGHVDS